MSQRAEGHPARGDRGTTMTGHHDSKRVVTRICHFLFVENKSAGDSPNVRYVHIARGKKDVSRRGVIFVG